MSRLTVMVLAAVMFGCGRPDEVQPNDNRTPAGTLTGDTLTINLVVKPARWHPEASDGPYADVEALGEEGKAPSIPAPLIRVRTGTVIKATVRNSLRDSTVFMGGLYSRPTGMIDTVGIAPGTSRTYTFDAGTPGTYMYGATVGAVDELVREREQLTGAFVVDSVNGRQDDRIFVINIWGEPRDSSFYRNALAINGKSFPYGETIEATTGDSLRWRWVNGTTRPHPMHLHGFYFNVTARGVSRSDTIYDAASERSVVTEMMMPFSTMSMKWSPDRDGQWLFHCHFPFHAISESARLDPASEHAMMSGDAREHMAGLVMGITVKPAAGWKVPARESPRTLRLFVREGPKLGRASRSLGYALEHGDGTPTDPLTRVGGPVLVLTRGQPTDITVINQLEEPTAVHWHGIELESYSDGVAGWSGAAGHTAPSIAPADSFVARLTMPRAGTFMYHTHLNDIAQLTEGLYGAIVVKEPHDPFDATFDHVYLAGWDGDFGREQRFLVNGDSTMAPVTWRVGQRHRIRLINIGAAMLIRAQLTQDSGVASWLPVAKDGFDLPQHQRVLRPAELTLSVGATADFEFTPTKRGEYVLSLNLVDSEDAARKRVREPMTQRITVR